MRAHYIPTRTARVSRKRSRNANVVLATYVIFDTAGELEGLPRSSSLTPAATEISPTIYGWNQCLVNFMLKSG